VSIHLYQDKRASVRNTFKRKQFKLYGAESFLRSWQWLSEKIRLL